MQTLIFIVFGLKMTIHAPNGIFLGFYPQNEEQSYLDVQKGSLCAETRHMTYRSLCSVHPFLKGSRHSIPIFYTGLPLPPLKIALPRVIWTPSNTWFLGPICAHNPNGISVGSSLFAGLTTVTDRPSHHAILGL